MIAEGNSNSDNLVNKVSKSGMRVTKMEAPVDTTGDRWNGDVTGHLKQKIKLNESDRISPDISQGGWEVKVASKHGGVNYAIFQEKGFLNKLPRYGRGKLFPPKHFMYKGMLKAEYMVQRHGKTYLRKVVKA